MAIGAILSAGVEGLGLLSQMGAQADQRNLSYLQLYEQKRQAREREELAKATRTDAYGNKVKYIPGQGFVTEVTGITRDILNAQQKEQLAQFRQDAPRDRAAAIRADKRAKQADEVFDEKFNKYRYGRDKSEEEYIAQAVQDAVTSHNQRQRGGGDNNEQLARSIMRLGNSSAARNIYQAAQSTEEQSLAEAIANAKKAGTQQYLAEKGARNSVAFDEINQLQALASATNPSNLNWGNENAALSGRQDSALQGLIQTNAANSQAVGSAYNAAASAAGKSPDFSSFARALASIGSGSKQKSEEDIIAEYLAAQSGGAGSTYKGNSGYF